MFYNGESSQFTMSRKTATYLRVAQPQRVSESVHDLATLVGLSESLNLKKLDLHSSNSKKYGLFYKHPRRTTHWSFERQSTICVGNTQNTQDTVLDLRRSSYLV